ncbi:MAG: chemotaxis protein MotB [Magnetovibrio sp.]|nr:chemotaxis protein MotB [Magnetovibrio sp.]|tara:strand:+ start:374 stop:1102 length:729 start_codon:yes stop_codon:yes gene_type:complete
MSGDLINQEETGDQSTDAKTDQSWMLIFTDLVSLMLTFFVLLFSMSVVKVDAWNNVVSALSQSLKPSERKAQTEATSRFDISTLSMRTAINLDYLASVLEKTMASDELLKNAQLMRLEDRLVIGLPGDRLFFSDDAVLSLDARKALSNLGGVLRNIGNQIGTNGHTDPKPLKGSQYTSNWELSMGRATAVANALKRSGYKEDIISFGYASGRFMELPDLPDEERRVMGRRIDIVVYPTVRGF